MYVHFVFFCVHPSKLQKNKFSGISRAVFLNFMWRSCNRP